jgi:hypothetical protein
MPNPFTDHPRALGMSWLGHGIGAVGIGARMVGAGFACMVHAIVPALFTDTAGKTVVSLSEHMKQRKANAQGEWPDYEI